MATASSEPIRGYGQLSPPAQGGYDFEDPWDANGSIRYPNGSTANVSAGQRPRFSSMDSSRGSRPLTWGGHSAGSLDVSPATARVQGIDLPENFRQVWKQVCAYDAGEPGLTGYASEADPDTEITLGQLHRLLTAAGGLGAGTSEKIVNLSCSGSRCSRYDFCLALALLRQAQEGESLDAKRAALQLETGQIGSPSLELDRLLSTNTTAHTFPPPAGSSQSRPMGPVREMSDPWNSGISGPSNGPSDRFSLHHDGLPSSDTPGFSGAFRTRGASSDSEVAKSKMLGASSSDEPAFGAGYRVPTVDEDESEHGFGSTPGLGTSRFLDEPSGPGRSIARSRLNPGRRDRPFSYVSDAVEANAVGGAEDPEAALPVDAIAVRLRSELEGFIIKHNVYVVSSRLRGSSVMRRYSDWVWLAECLVKRYPFRCLPLLPPKRISLPVAGRHLSGDDQFIERRRRGLERYLRVLTSHPVLRQDKLVDVFLTEKKPLTEWRQSAPPLYLDEEGMTKVLDEMEQMAIPEDLDAKLDQQRKAIPEMLERWTSTVALFERMVKRTDAAAADFSRFNFGLLSLVESSSKRWRPESDARKVAEGCLGRVAEASQDYADLLGARSSSASTATLESLKHQRDLICSFRDLFYRLDRLLPDQVEGLQRRMDLSSKRAAQIRREERPNWEQEYEKIVAQLAADTALVEKLMNRRIHTRKAMWEEMVWMHWRYQELEETWKKWVKDEVVFSQSTLRNWELLAMKLDV